MNKTPMATIPNPYGAPSGNAPGGQSGQVGGAVSTKTVGVRRDFTYTPLFNPALSVNGQTGVPRG
jgi:hypothetical protein